MKELTIGTRIMEQRKQRGLTQEAVAEFLGVSKAAVSKWESGQSYPDITLLPLLAAYFDTTVDQLLGYQPQLSREEISALYQELAHDFSTQPFAAVQERCREYLKEYYHCWKLQYHLCQLLVNYAPQAGSPEAMQAVLGECREILHRVAAECGLAPLARQAALLEAVCCLSVGQPQQVIERLADCEQQWPLAEEVVLAQAYQQSGAPEKAQALLQKLIFGDLVELYNAAPNLLLLLMGEPDKARACYERMLAVGQAFNWDQLHPALALSLHAVAALVFLQQGREEAALTALEAYADLATSGIFPLTLHGDDFFDHLDEQLAQLDLGTQLPRDDAAVKADLAQTIAANPAFALLAENERYQMVCRRLANL